MYFCFLIGQHSAISIGLFCSGWLFDRINQITSRFDLYKISYKSGLAMDRCGLYLGKSTAQLTFHLSGHKSSAYFASG